MLHTQKKTTGFKHNLIHSVDGCGLWLRCRDGVEQWVEEQCQERPVGIISVGHWIRRGGGGCGRGWKATPATLCTEVTLSHSAVCMGS